MPGIHEDIERFIDSQLNMFRPTDVCWLKKLLEQIIEASNETEQAVLHIIAIACPIFPEDGAIDVIVTEEDSARAITHTQIIRELTKFLSQYEIGINVHFSVSNIQPLIYPLAYEAIVERARVLREDPKYNGGLIAASDQLVQEVAAATMPTNDPRFSKYKKFLQDYIFEKAMNDLVLRGNSSDKVHEKTHLSTKNSIRAIQNGMNDGEKRVVTFTEHPDHLSTIIDNDNYLNRDPLEIVIELMKKMAMYEFISWDGDSENDYEANSFLNSLYAVDMLTTVQKWVTPQSHEGVIWLNLMNPEERQSKHIQTLLSDPVFSPKVDYPVIRGTGSHTKRKPEQNGKI